MKLPNGERAVVEDAKLRDYVLNPFHPVGRHHAILFKNLLDIGPESSEILKTALLAAAKKEDIVWETRTPHGLKFEMRFQMRGQKGTKDVIAV